ncbi:MAG: helix-hairpin-helix domain-containing protein [Planctomycetota bacterium]
MLLGWLSGAALLAGADGPAALPSSAADCTLECAPLPAPAPAPRTWRSVPGIGRTRALALARAVWEAGVRDPRSLDLTQVPGVGEVTAARARAWLGAR